MVRLDANACLPRVGFTLTTKAARTPPGDFRESVAQCFRKLRRERWARDARYLGMIEFTTGKGPRSGGVRRIHQHGLLKDVDPARAGDVGELLRTTWLRRTGAHRVEAHELHRPAGAMAYLVNHHHKSAQTPPRGWSGKRLRPSKGYYEQPICDLRERARELLTDRRIAKAVAAELRECGAWEELDGAAYDDLFARIVAERKAQPPPRLVHTTTFARAGDGGS